MQLDRETYTNSKVVGLAKKLVAVKLDLGKDSSEKIARKYHIAAAPTILFVDGTGKEIRSFLGFLPPDKFSREMIAAMRPASGKHTPPKK